MLPQFDVASLLSLKCCDSWRRVNKYIGCCFESRLQQENSSRNDKSKSIFKIISPEYFQRRGEINYLVLRLIDWEKQMTDTFQGRLGKGVNETERSSFARVRGCQLLVTARRTFKDIHRLCACSEIENFTW